MKKTLSSSEARNYISRARSSRAVLISVVGARPNFIKLAALELILKKYFTHIIVHTGQHYDPELSEVFFKEFKIPSADYNLAIGSGTHAQQTAKTITRLEKIFKKVKPSMVIVYGDTNSTLGGAICASKMDIPVAHVEAGLRSFDRSMPEEINRIIVDHISSILFCPTITAVKNLKLEAVEKNVFLTGDLMYGLFLKMKPENRALAQNNLKQKQYYYATIHRQENTGINKLTNIISIFEKLDKPVIFPAHPRTSKQLSKLPVVLKNTKAISPVNYRENIALMQNSLAILTDSGGIQKEAYWLKIPCVTFRKTTEWPETIDSGWNIFASDDPVQIINFSRNFVRKRTHPNFFGSQHASLKITKTLKNYLP